MESHIGTAGKGEEGSPPPGVTVKSALPGKWLFASVVRLEPFGDYSAVIVAGPQAAAACWAGGHGPGNVALMTIPHHGRGSRATGRVCLNIPSEVMGANAPARKGGAHEYRYGSGEQCEEAE